MRYVKIPNERVAVLVGKNGNVKQQIEQHGVILDIDSKIGDVIISSEDSLAELDAERVVKAIGRGFSPEHAFRLFSESQYFELLDMRNFAGKKAKDVHRIAGRVIGKNGRTREIIEESLGVNISIFGTTVAIIGDGRSVDAAVKAVEMLLNGANHASAYRLIQKERRRIKLDELGFR